MKRACIGYSPIGLYKSRYSFHSYIHNKIQESLHKNDSFYTAMLFLNIEMTSIRNDYSSYGLH